jgi:hypothetical protein
MRTQLAAALFALCELLGLELDLRDHVPRALE